MFLLDAGVVDPHTCQPELRPLRPEAPLIATPNMFAVVGVRFLCELFGEAEGECPDERVDEPDGFREVSPGWVDMAG